MTGTMYGNKLNTCTLEGVANYTYNSRSNIKQNAGSLSVTPEVERLFISASGTARPAQTNTDATLNTGKM